MLKSSRFSLVFICSIRITEREKERKAHKVNLMWKCLILTSYQLVSDIQKLAFALLQTLFG